MTRKSFLLGKTISNKPILYQPSPLLTQSESILIQGNNIALNFDITTKIILQSIHNEPISWIYIHSFENKHTFENLIQYDIPSYNYYFIQKLPFFSNQIQYLIPLRFIQKEEFIKFARISIEKEYRNICGDLFHDIRASLIEKSITFLTFENFNLAFDFEIKKNNEKTIYFQMIKNSFNQMKQYLTEDYNSNIFKQILSNYIDKKNGIYHIYLPLEKPTSFCIPIIITELKSIYTKELHRYMNNLIGIVIDDINMMTKDYSIYNALYNLLFSWGRTYKITRILICNDIELTSHMFEDECFNQDILNEINNKDLSGYDTNFRSLGTYNMIFYTSEDIPLFSYINKFLIDSNNNSNLDPLRIDSILLDSQIYRVD